MVKQIAGLFKTGNFIYGGYKERPSLPYGNYGRQESKYFYTDDKCTLKINAYIVRIVTADKDFALEEQIENIFDDLEIGYQVITDEELEKEKVHCTEWLIEVID